MDSLVLAQVARALRLDLTGSAIRSIRVESTHRLRLVFERQDRVLSCSLSLNPGRPWIGRVRRSPAGRSHASGAADAKLRGRIVEDAAKVEQERSLRIAFAGGAALVAELVPGAANLVLVDEDGIVAAAERRGSARRPVRVGATYLQPPPRSGAIDVLAAGAAEIDACVAEASPEGDEAGVRRALGLSAVAVRLAREEAGRTGATLGTVLERRLAALVAGGEPCIEARGTAESFDPHEARLLPWEPDVPPAAGTLRFREGDAASTAGAYYDALERSEAWGERLRGLAIVLRRECERVAGARVRVEADRAALPDPERMRRAGEALLAGAAKARRAGAAIVVPDPYDPAGAEIAVPAAPGVGPVDAAEACFRGARRARRGIEATERRARALSERSAALERLVAAAPPDGAGAEDVATFETALRAAGIPVGLERAVRGKPASAAPRPVRLEGVRLATSVDGWTMLIGRTARDNQRLTFRLAAPDDFWFHAAGARGAHVVVRNPLRVARPPRGTLEEAAAAAAWFSEARGGGWVDVQWTRCKYVRRVRHAAAPGAVRLKRHETVRVRPAFASDGAR